MPKYVPFDALPPHVLEWCSEPGAVGLLYRIRFLGRKEAAEANDELVALLRSSVRLTQDDREALAAFFERRGPKKSGRLEGHGRIVQGARLAIERYFKPEREEWLRVNRRKRKL